MPEDGITKRGFKTLSSAFKGSVFKTGSDVKGSDVLDKQASADARQTNAFWYSPELTNESWLLPKSRQEILKWCRIFFNLEPYIQSILMLHAYYPFSKFDIVSSDKSITEFYNEMAFNENFDLYTFILQASISHEKFGEAVCFGNVERIKEGVWSGKKRWSKFILLEPELVEVKQSSFQPAPEYELIPTEEMKALIKSSNPEDIKRREGLPPLVIDCVTRGKNIPLDPRNVSVIQRLTDPSATRGTPKMQGVFKVLIYQDKIRLAQMAAADRYHFPIELWTLGDVANGIMPSEQDLQNARDMINQAIQNPPFSMVFPPIIKYEALGVMGKLLPVSDDYEYIQDQIMVGLGVNKNIITGEGPSFSNLKSMSLQNFTMMAKVKRDQFENWIINKFFRPIAIDNGFYYYSGKVKKLVLPQISWYKSLDIEEENAERDVMVKLHEKGFVSTKTMFSKFPNLEIDTEKKNLEDEKGTVWDKGDKRIPKAFIPSDSTGPSFEPSTSGPTTSGPEGTIPETVPEAGPGAETPTTEAVPAPAPAETPAPAGPGPAATPPAPGV